jgi:hypothetical protein
MKLGERDVRTCRRALAWTRRRWIVGVLDRASFAAKIAIASSLVSTVVNAVADDYSWLEGEWVSDADATMAANPQMQTLPSETRGKLRQSYGRLHWRVDSDHLEAQWPGSPSYPSTYALRDLGNGKIELSVFERGETQLSELWRTAEGFCVQPQIDDAAIAVGVPLPFVECFRPTPRDADEH